MEFVIKRSYRGSLKAAIFDWAGTTVDFGCLAPAGAFIELFRRHGVTATTEQARGPMGMHKRDHIRTMLAEPALRQQWLDVHGAAPTEEKVEALFQEFIPMQLDVLPKYAGIIPGVAETVYELRKQGMKIGATTGYNTEMMQICRDSAARAGYDPDISVANTEVPAGRPEPWMAVKAAMEMRVYPFEAIVKIGDTVTDVLEGLNGGMWTIALTETGNEVGLSEADLNALAPEDRAARHARAADKLAAAGAHYVIKGVADMLPVVDDINARLAQGERP